MKVSYVYCYFFYIRCWFIVDYVIVKLGCFNDFLIVIYIFGWESYCDRELICFRVFYKDSV